MLLLSDLPMQSEKPRDKLRNILKPKLTIKTKNLNFKAQNESTSDSPVKKRLRKASENLKSLQNIDLRREITIKQGFEDCYELDQKVGEGGHSVVYKCKDLKTHKTYAVKVTRKNDPENLQSLKEQYRILASLDHEGILKGHFLFLNQKKSLCHLVCQYYDFPNLREYMIQNKTQSITQQKSRQIIKLILEAVYYLHEQKVSHRDLKPQNILYNEQASSIKIIDFEVAKMPRYTHEKLQMWTKAGTPSYRSPELLQGSYNELTDMWSLGIIAFQILTGKFPLNLSYQKNLCHQIMNFVPNFEGSGISEIAKNFISKLLKRDPKQRMSAKQALSHPFILSLTISTPLSAASQKKLNSSFDMDENHVDEEDEGNDGISPKSKFYDENVKLTFLGNIDKDIGIRFCEE